MLAAVVAFIAGCGQGFHVTMDISGFEEQVLAFEDASNEAGKPITITNLIVRFNGDLNASHEAGVCFIGSPIPYIEIDPTYWSHASEIQKEILMFHELGHCALKREHRNDFNGIMPYSIMYYSMDAWTTLTQQAYYELNRHTYVKELFN